MNKRQRLRINTPNNSLFIPTSDHSNAEMTQDSTIIFPKKIETDEISAPFDIASDPLHFESSICEDLAAPIQSTSKNENRFRNLFTLNMNYTPYFLLSALIIYFTFKPSEYKFLLEEIEKLRVQSSIPQIKNKIENIACLSEGCHVGVHSELYKYGFLMSSISDKNSILEPGMVNLAMKSDKGFIDIHVKPNSKIVKFALYHPEIANKGSAIKDFSIVINEKTFDFQFQGKGYQEFSIDPQISDSLRIVFYNNHGEPRYTSIYRIFIFA